MPRRWLHDPGAPRDRSRGSAVARAADEQSHRRRHRRAGRRAAGRDRHGFIAGADRHADRRHRTERHLSLRHRPARHLHAHLRAQWISDAEARRTSCWHSARRSPSTCSCRCRACRNPSPSPPRRRSSTRRRPASGSTLNTEKLIGVPTATDLWSALARAPGVRMQGYDVGGSHKSEQSGYEAFGVRGQSRVVTEGVDTTEGSGGAGFYQDYYAQNEIAVSAAGQDVTMNTPGAAVISTIKSGGNAFKACSTPPTSRTAGSPTTSTMRRRRADSPACRTTSSGSSIPDLGGPIVNDRLWFFGAYNHFTIDEDITGVPHDRATYQGYYNNYTTKETFKASEKDTIIGYYQLGRLRTPNRNLSALTSPDRRRRRRAPPTCTTASGSASGATVCSPR